MPRCENCTEHFKMNGYDVPMQIYDFIGKRICPECAPQYLRELRNAKQ